MKKILVVDDDQFILELVKSALGTEDYDIHTAFSADEAVRLVDTESFDFLITDIVMPPGQDGTKLIQYVKAKYPGMPVLAMTGGIENAVNDYVNLADMFSDYTLKKPFGKEELIEAISELSA
jgi:DNA-binding response OmpR family regulator